MEFCGKNLLFMQYIYVLIQNIYIFIRYSAMKF